MNTKSNRMSELTKALEAKKNALKHVAKAAESTTHSEQQLCNDSDDYRRLMAESFLENYYASIKDESFATVFFDMTKPQARAVLEQHKRYLQSQEFDATHADLLALERAVDEAKRKLYGDDGAAEQKVFVRLSTRSPKDAPLLLKDFGQLVRDCRQRLAQCNHAETDDKRSDENMALHALQIASTIAVGCDCGRDAVRLLVLSKRIQGDLEQFCNDELHVASDSTKAFKVAVRKFQFFPLDFELRAFVYQSRLTAITQYNPFIYFPALAARKNAIEQLVKKFIDQIITHVPMKNFVLDLLLVDASRKNDIDAMFVSSSSAESDWKVRIVELNPFAEFAGDGLFSWVTEKSLLMGHTSSSSSSSSVVFRIVDDVSKVQASASMSSEWRRFIE